MLQNDKVTLFMSSNNMVNVAKFIFLKYILFRLHCRSYVYFEAQEGSDRDIV